MKGNSTTKNGGVIAGKPAQTDKGAAGSTAKPNAAASGNGASPPSVMSANAGSMSMNGNSSNNDGSGDDNASGDGNNGSSNKNGAAGQNAMMPAGGQAAPAANPANTAAACTDHAGETVCDNTTLYQCGDMGVVMKKQSCTNAKRCQAGTKTGECGMCDPGQFHCEDVELQACDDTGQWTKSMTCPSKELCSEKNHTCDPMACAKDSFDCSAGELRKCSVDLTQFETVMACDMELCDSQAGKCNECVPNSNNCDAAGTAVIACSADGKKTMTACSGNTPFCTQGKCVACKADSDCKSTSDCRIPACSAGMCSTGTSKPVHTACSSNMGKVCDLIGNCVPCFDDTDCSPDQKCNPLNVFTPCEARQPLEVATPVLAGVFSMTVAPGFDVKLKITDPAGTLRSTLTVRMSDRPFNTECAPWATDECTIPKASMARTLTITGPMGNCTAQNLQHQIQAARNDVTFDFATTPPANSDGSAGTPDCSMMHLEVTAVSATK